MLTVRKLMDTVIQTMATWNHAPIDHAHPLIGNATLPIAHPPTTATATATAEITVVLVMARTINTCTMTLITVLLTTVVLNLTAATALAEAIVLGQTTAMVLVTPWAATVLVGAIDHVPIAAMTIKGAAALPLTPATVIEEAIHPGPTTAMALPAASTPSDIVTPQTATVLAGAVDPVANAAMTITRASILAQTKVTAPKRVGTVE